LAGGAAFAVWTVRADRFPELPYPADCALDVGVAACLGKLADVATVALGFVLFLRFVLVALLLAAALAETSGFAGSVTFAFFFVSFFRTSWFGLESK